MNALPGRYNHKSQSLVPTILSRAHVPAFEIYRNCQHNSTSTHDINVPSQPQTANPNAALWLRKPTSTPIPIENIITVQIKYTRHSFLVAQPITSAPIGLSPSAPCLETQYLLGLINLGLAERIAG